MLSERSKQIRRDTIKLSIENGGYHWGGSFSCVEILIAIYDHIIEEQDRFILSKGHSCWPYYVILRELGFNPKLEGHPTRDEHNQIWTTTGSLGHGFPVGVGMALAKKIMGYCGDIYVLVGDGECQEGTTWESMLIAKKHNLSNLKVIVDNNKCQGSGITDEILPIDLFSMFNSAGWDVKEVDGHNVQSLMDALTEESVLKATAPRLVVANTVKGKGVTFMENKPEWHSKWLGNEHKELALMELQ